MSDRNREYTQCKKHLNVITDWVTRQCKRQAVKGTHFCYQHTPKQPKKRTGQREE